MKELFKWMDTHPDIVLEIEHVDSAGYYGYLKLTMRHRHWNIVAKEIIMLELIDAACCPDEMLKTILDNHYNSLINIRAGCIDDRMSTFSKEGGTIDGR